MLPRCVEIVLGNLKLSELRCLQIIQKALKTFSTTMLVANTVKNCVGTQMGGASVSRCKLD